MQRDRNEQMNILKFQPFRISLKIGAKEFIYLGGIS